MNLDIEVIFAHHPPRDQSVADAHAELREALKRAAYAVDSLVPASPEKTLSIRRLQEAMMYGNAAIAIYQ